MPPREDRQAPPEPPPVEICSCCDEEVESGEEYSSVDGSICEGCFDEHYFCCESCSESHHLDNSVRSPDDMYYCEDCYSDTFTHCYDCSEPVYHDYMYEGDDGEYRCEDCHDHNGCSSDNFFEQSPNKIQVTHHNSVDYNKLDIKRLVGIEAECVFGDCETDEEGNPMALRGSNIPTGWREAYDGSIEGNGREMISSPANGNILWTRIKLLENWATEHNVYVNRSCGMHIHFDATDTTWEDLRAIALVTLKIEQHLFDMLPPSRQNSNWCKRISMPVGELIDCSSEEEFVQLWYEESGISREKYNDSRYHGLNLHARFYLGTIEFRYHSGTLNSEKIINWVKICNSIVNTGLLLSRDKSWEKGREFYYDTAHIDIVSGGIRKEQKLSSLASILKHMVDMDVSVVQYMIKRMKKFTHLSSWDERHNVTHSYLNNINN